METRLFLLAATGALFLSAHSAAGADPKSAAVEFSRDYPGASFVTDMQTNGRYYIVRGFRSSPLKGDPAEAARLFALEHGELIGLGAKEAGLASFGSAAHLGKRSYRFHQTLHDLPVFNARVVVSVDEQGRAYKMSSKAVSTVPSAPRGEIDALDAELAAIGGSDDVGPAVQTDLGWMAVQDSARLVWRVVTPATGARVLVSYIDARSGISVFRADLVRHVQANVFPENPTVDGATSIVDLANVTGDTGTATGLTTTGDYALVRSCTNMNSYGMCNAWTSQAYSNANEFLDVVPDLANPTASSDPFAETSAYYYVDKQNTWFRGEFGFDGQYADMDDTDVDADAIWVLVNLDMENAFYMGGSEYGSYMDVGDSINTGQGFNGADTIDFSYDGDVLFHEFTHSVSDKAFNVGYGAFDDMGVNQTAGGVEEGNADYFAVSHHGNSVLGEYSLGSASGRDADNDASCPNNLVGEGHADSLMVSGALWEIRESLGQDKTDHLNYGAMTSSAIDTFAEFSEALIAEAEDMALAGDYGFSSADVDLVSSVLEARGLVDCERVVDLWVDGAPVTKMHFANYDITGGEGGTPSAMQYRIVTGDAPQSIKLIIEPLAPSYYPGTAGVLMRAGSPVSFSWSGSGYSFSWTAEYDAEWTGESVSAPPSDVELTRTSEISVEPNTEYYFSVLCIDSNWGSCANSVTAEVVDDGDDTGDAGTDDADAGADAGTKKGDSGCGCESVGTEPSAEGLFGALLSII